MTTKLNVPDLLGTSPADLIDPGADMPPSDRETAVRRADRIRAGVVSYAAMRQDIADAYAQRDWRALDYGSWREYVQSEFGEQLRQLAREERQEAAKDLREQGMSTRQIASATGVSREQVRRDLAQVTPDVSPETRITGTDGKTYAASKPAAPTPEADGQPVAATLPDQTDRTPGPASDANPPASPAPEPAAASATPPQGSAAAGSTPARDEHHASLRRAQDIAVARQARQRVERLIAELDEAVALIRQGVAAGGTDLIAAETVTALRNLAAQLADCAEEIETPEQAAAIVDANLVRMGCAGLEPAEEPAAGEYPIVLVANDYGPNKWAELREDRGDTTVKVVYLHSRTGAWINRSRIIDEPTIAHLPPVTCEACGNQVEPDEAALGYQRCDECDPDGEHRTVNDDPWGPCKKCRDKRSAARLAAVQEVAPEFVAEVTE